MLGSNAIEVAIGLILVFFVFSLMASGLNEGIATLLEVRAKFLIKGIRKLVDGSPDETEDPDPETSRAMPTQQQLQQALASNRLTHWLFKHPIIDDLKRPGWRNRRRKPSYMSSRNFTAALVDVLVPDAHGATSLDQLRNSVLELPDVSGLKRPVLALIDEANGNMTAFRSAAERWFDDQMDLVGGWYKRWARKVLFTIGVVVAVALNVDTIRIARELWRNAPLRAVVAAQAGETQECRPEEDSLACAERQLANLDELPIGWTVPENCLDGKPCHGLGERLKDVWERVRDNGLGDALVKLLGWGVTAGALSFGAPFWFDLLSKAGPLHNAKAPPRSKEAAPLG